MSASRIGLRRVACFCTFVVLFGAAERLPAAGAQNTAPVYLAPHEARARLTNYEAPAYPKIAQVVRAAGVVRVEAIISAEGIVQSTLIANSIPMLDQAAMDAVGTWTFAPFTVNDRPTPTRTFFLVAFEAQRGTNPTDEDLLALENALFACEVSARGNNFAEAETRCALAAKAASHSRLTRFRAHPLRLQGVALFQQERSQEALPIFEEAVEASRVRDTYSEEYVRSLLILAQVHRTLGQPDAALRSYEQVERQLNVGRRDSLRGSPFHAEKTAELRSLLLEMAETFDEAGKTRDAERARSRAESLK